MHLKLSEALLFITDFGDQAIVPPAALLILVALCVQISVVTGPKSGAEMAPLYNASRTPSHTGLPSTAPSDTKPQKG